MNCVVCEAPLDATQITETVPVPPYLTVTDTEGAPDVCEAESCLHAAMSLANRGARSWNGFVIRPDAADTEVPSSSLDDSPFPPQ